MKCVWKNETLDWSPDVRVRSDVCCSPTDKCPSSSPHLVSGAFIPVGTEWFPPKKKIVRKKRLARVQKYKFISEKNTMMVQWQKKKILQCFKSLFGTNWQRKEVKDGREFKTSLRAEALWKNRVPVFFFPNPDELAPLRADYESRAKATYVLITPLLGSCLGRQGSSGSGSWANTESSPDEQVLLES